MSIRETSLFVVLSLAAACGSEFDSQSPEEIDAGVDDAIVHTADVARGDQVTQMDAAPSEGGADAPPRSDASVDGGNQDRAVLDIAPADVAIRVDARADGAGAVDAPVKSDVTIDSDAGRSVDAPSEGGFPSCVGAVDPNFLREKLAQLSGALPVQIGGVSVTIPERNSALNRERARQFLASEYQALGFSVSEHTYATGVNFIAEKAGTGSKYLIVSAHYDSIRDTVAGADDDGSGVIAGLAVAKALAGCQLDHGLRIVAFDEEEDGLLGSKAYVSKLQAEGAIATVLGDVQLEMLGYHTKADGGFLLVDCKSSEGDKPDSKFLNDAVLRAISRGNLNLEPRDSCTSSSDHAPFWGAAVPAIVYSQEFFFSGADSTPCHHKDCDEIDQINFDYYAKLATMSVVLTADLVGAR